MSNLEPQNLHKPAILAKNKGKAVESGQVSGNQPAATPTRWNPTIADIISLSIVVVAISTSGPIVAAATAPAIAMAFWRCTLGAGLTLPSALREGGLRRLTRTELKGSINAGLLLGAHFALWIPAIRMTNVAASTALVSTQALWLAFIAKFRGEYVARATWIGVTIAFAGVLVITGFDLGTGSRALLGDAMSIASAIVVAFYMLVGAKVRQNVATSTYTVVVYLTSGITLGLVAVMFGASLAGFSSRDWWLILALTLGPQLLGHSMMNRVVRTVPATIIGAAVLLEIPGTALLTALWLGQAVSPQIWLGIALILVGLIVITRAKQAPSVSELEGAL